MNVKGNKAKNYPLRTAQSDFEKAGK